METVSIQINDENAYKILESMEAMHAIKILGSTSTGNSATASRYPDVVPELKKLLAEMPENPETEEERSEKARLEDTIRRFESDLPMGKKFAGILSKETADRMLAEVEKGRNEW
ncbi:MAG: hypothetical protein V4543_11430 [Bacteroidota bacterium]